MAKQCIMCIISMQAGLRIYNYKDSEKLSSNRIWKRELNVETVQKFANFLFLNWLRLALGRVAQTTTSESLSDISFIIRREMYILKNIIDNFKIDNKSYECQVDINKLQK